MLIDIIFQSLATIVAAYMVGGFAAYMVGGFQTELARARTSRSYLPYSKVLAPILEASEPPGPLVPARIRRHNTIAPIANPVLVTPYREGRIEPTARGRSRKPKKTLSSVIEGEYTRTRYTREELQGRTVVQLRRLARGVPGAGSMRKNSLIAALLA
jgi:hypothetical protein